MNDCVCGYGPPNDPNLDCERCRLVVRVAELKQEVEQLRTERDEARKAARRLNGNFSSLEHRYQYTKLHPWLEE